MLYVELCIYNLGLYFSLVIYYNNVIYVSVIVLSRVLVTETGFGSVFGFINHLQVVTAIKYHTVPAFHATNHSTISLS
jgi:hypothetical protein